MGRVATSAAALHVSRGISWVGRATFVAATFASSFVLAAWVVDFDIMGWLHGQALPKAAAALSFDDRFGSRSALNTASIYYPSRRGVRSARGDFKTEFEQIEGLLAQQSDESDADRPEQPAPPAVVATAPSVPMPRARPPEANLQLATAALPRSDVASAPAPSANRTFLQKLADLVPGRITLASLDPNSGIGGSAPDLGALGFDNVTAVYDITARAVYMPDGTRLEAHSGMGALMDDPANVDKPMVGATPPTVYDLKPRERLFHGVQALRMTPVDNNGALGRVGLLVHSYMLGPNGDSNGCVSIKAYDRFLRAYQNGEVRRLVVVPDLNDKLASQRSSSQS